MNYIRISEEYFLNCTFPNRQCHKKAVCLDPNYHWEKRAQYNHEYELKSVRDVVEYFKQDGAIEKAESKLKEDNWEYFNCLLYGWRKNVLDTDIHKKDGGAEISLEERNKTLSPEYYQSLEKMSDKEIQKFNTLNPIEFDGDIIRHGTHRVYAMIGRLVRGEPYIPFWVEPSRIKKHMYPITNINFIDVVDEVIDSNFRNEYVICQSSWLAMMGIRKNDDLDIVISSKIRENTPHCPDTEFKARPNIEVFEKNHGKFKVFGCKDDDDLVKNYSINIGGYNFCEPRFYFSRIWPDKDSKIKDQQMIKEFFDKGKHKKYPFSEITEEQWGLDLLPKGRKGAKNV
jgi:hypothetical protein